MKPTLTTLVRATAVVLVAVVATAAALPAAAGCLTEYGECGDCARQSMINAILSLDLEGGIDAYVEGIDCDIDLFHCLVYDHHHEYNCGA